MNKRTIARLRAAAAYEALRGRPPKPDYGLLLVMPFVAAAGGALIAWRVEEATSRWRARQVTATSDHEPATSDLDATTPDRDSATPGVDPATPDLDPVTTDLEAEAEPVKASG
jgi:hypothetical protein